MAFYESASLGVDRTGNFASPGGAARGGRRVFGVPARLGLNQWALSGDWTVAGNAISLHKAGGRIAYRFHARDLHLVMGLRPGDRRSGFACFSTGSRRRGLTEATWTPPATEPRRSSGCNS